MGKKYTPSQQRVIDSRGRDLLVSASAGTGKTTVMIERIAQLLENGLDVSELVVVTFTNLAAAEMKNRLSEKLAEKRSDKKIADQLERLEAANISTLHSFCSELLRNYFYVVDIDPTFDILDTATVSALQKTALDRVFEKYFSDDDEDFRKIYKIFARKRLEENFRKVITDLYGFGSCIGNFSDWYAEKRKYLLEYDVDNPIAQTARADIKRQTEYYSNEMRDLCRRSREEGFEFFADVFDVNEKTLRGVLQENDFQKMLDLVCRLSLEKLPNRNEKKSFGGDKDIENNIRDVFKELYEGVSVLKETYSALCGNRTLSDIWKQMREDAYLIDKLVEVTLRFEEEYFSLKKEKNGLDFSDLEHLTLKLLSDPESLSSIKGKYKMIFVDEYQDTNPVQEEIISKLASKNGLFTVGDVKQSIYGFRGCEPEIFVEKYSSYKKHGEGHVEELNDNFRSNKYILQFVNLVFSQIMTNDFGKVDYKNDALLRGETEPALNVISARLDLILKKKKEDGEISEIYDISAPVENNVEDGCGELVAKRVKEYVGLTYLDKDGKEKTVGYGDIVILMRSLTDKAIAIYNTLVSKNIPVVANFKTEGLQNKEARDLVNLLRVIDNPHNDVYMVGVCLSCFGNITESELGIVRLDALGKIQTSFYDRLKNYVKNHTNTALSDKINTLMAFLAQIRFYSRSATAGETLLKVLEITDYRLYVMGLPNGSLRLRKLYDFLDGISCASYAETVDGFLAYLDETDDIKAEEGLSCKNAVRIMSMHASKGLEFPVVIIPAVESKFNFDTKEIERNFGLGVAFKHYDFETMKSSKTLSLHACRLSNMQKQREEEMRILYVAMTRAKYALDIIGVIGEKQLHGAVKLPAEANSHLDWILGAVKRDGSDVRSARSICYEVNVFRDARAEKEEYVLQKPEQEKNADRVLADINYEYKFKDEENMPSKLASSALDRAFTSLNDTAVKSIVEDDKNKIGTAYHKVYQYVSYSADEREIRETVEGLVNEGLIERKYAEAIDVGLVYATLNNSELVELTEGGTVYHEMPFMLSVPYNEVVPDGEFHDETMLQGVIDLLVIKKDRAVVVDFKYTSRSDRAQKIYQAQINSYKLAVQRICGIEKVDCYILSISDNKLIKMI